MGGGKPAVGGSVWWAGSRGCEGMGKRLWKQGQQLVWAARGASQGTGRELVEAEAVNLLKHKLEQADARPVEEEGLWRLGAGRVEVFQGMSGRACWTGQFVQTGMSSSLSRQGQQEDQTGRARCLVQAK